MPFNYCNWLYNNYYIRPFAPNSGNNHPEQPILNFNLGLFIDCLKTATCCRKVSIYIAISDLSLNKILKKHIMNIIIIRTIFYKIINRFSLDFNKKMISYKLLIYKSILFFDKHTLSLKICIKIFKIICD